MAPTIIIGLAGGLGLFLYGMKLMSEAPGKGGRSKDAKCPRIFQLRTALLECWWVRSLLQLYNLPVRLLLWW